MPCASYVSNYDSLKMASMANLRIYTKFNTLSQASNIKCRPVISANIIETITDVSKQ